MKATAALAGVVLAMVLGGCGGSPKTATPTHPSSHVQSSDPSPDAVNPNALLASLAPTVKRVRTDLEAIHYLNTAITTGPAEGGAEVFGDLVDMIRHRFGRDLDLFEARLKATAEGGQRDFADSLDDLRQVESRGMVVTDVASPSADEIQAFFDAVDAATASWNRDVSSLWAAAPDRNVPLADPTAAPTTLMSVTAGRVADLGHSRGYDPSTHRADRGR